MQIIQAVYPSIPWKTSWDRLMSYIDQCQQHIKVTMGNWERPLTGIYKLNTDGSAMHNQIGGRGILRDHQGNMTYAFTISFGFGTNYVAEIQDALH